MRLLALLLCSPAFAATLLKVAAGPGAGWVSDSPYVVGGAVQAVASGQVAPYSALRFSPAGVPIKYSFPSLAATSVTLYFIEPRANQTVGQRIQTVTVNGVAVLISLDLFAVGGALTAQSYTFPVAASTGPLTITIQSSAGNSIVSGISIDGPEPPAAAVYLTGPESAAPNPCPGPLVFYVATDTKVLQWCSNALDAIGSPGWHEINSLGQLIPPTVVCAVPDAEGIANDPRGNRVMMSKWSSSGQQCQIYPRLDAAGKPGSIDALHPWPMESQCKAPGATACTVMGSPVPSELVGLEQCHGFGADWNCGGIWRAVILTPGGAKLWLAGVVNPVGASPGFVWQAP